MQENEFEKRIRNKMDDLTIVPAEEVWKNVFNEIRREKRKKRGLIFLLLIALLAGSAGIYLLVNRSRPQHFTSNATPVTVAEPKGENADNAVHIQAGTISKKGTDNSAAGSLKRSTTAAVKNNLFAYKKQQQAKMLSIESSPVKKATSKRTGVFDLAAGKSNLLQIPNDKKLDANKTAETPRRAEATTSISNSKPEIKTRLTDSAKTDVSASKPATPTQDTIKPFAVKMAASKKELKAPTMKKWGMGFTLFGGISNNMTRLSLAGNPNVYYSTAANASAGNGGFTGTSTAAALSYAHNVSYGFGIFVKCQLSSVVAFTAGVNYHFSAASSAVGIKRDTIATFYDSTSGIQTAANEFYNGGQVNRYNNKYYLLQLPIEIQVRLNKNKNKPFYLTAGLSPSYLVASNALFANVRQNVFYKNNDQFTKFGLFAQAGFQYTCISTLRSAISIGPDIQYGLTNMVKPYVTTPQHLFTASIKANISLK